MSQQGLCGLTNAFITCESSLRGDFDSIFHDYFWVKRGCVGWRIHSPPVKAVSGAISEWAASQFFLTVYESRGAVWPDESICHLWKEFRGLLLSGQRLSFPWLFMSHQGLFGLPNQFVTWESNLGAISKWAASQFSLTLYEPTEVVWADESIHHLWKQSQGRFLRGQRLSFSWLFMSQKGLCGLTNPFASCESSFGGYIWMGCEAVFLDCLWVKRGCLGDESICHLWKQFQGLYLNGQRISFPWLFLSQQGWLGWQIHSPPVKVVSGVISEWASSQFFLTVYESTGVVGADESIRPLWKEFRWLFLTGQRISFLWLFMSQQRLWGLTNPFVTCEKSLEGNFWVGSD